MAIQIPEGFTAHHGGECPCPGKPADVMFFDGRIINACVQMKNASGWSWSHHDPIHAADIAAYRIARCPACKNGDDGLDTPRGCPECGGSGERDLSINPF